MCLAVPLTIKELLPDGKNAVAERDGVTRTINVSFLREPHVGDHVIVHAGFAIEKIKAQQAADVLSSYNELMQELAAIEQGTTEEVVTPEAVVAPSKEVAVP